MTVPTDESPAATRARELLIANRDLVEKTVAISCRRNGFSDEEAAEFQSFVSLKLVQSEYRILRQFKARSSLATYLAVVVTNLRKDFLVSRKGRWRPSAIAQRHGPVGVRLEEMVYRHGYRIDEAIATLRAGLAADSSERELRRLFDELPNRRRHQTVGGDALDSVPARDRADARVEESERVHTAQRVRSAMNEALSALPAEDQVILKMRFWHGVPVATIAETLGLPRRRLYRRLERDFAQLRTKLEDIGVGRDDVNRLVDSDAL